MTGVYDWFLMPHVLDVRCPRCRACARFEHVEVVRIARKSDLVWFRDSSFFEVRFFRRRHVGESHWGAIYFAGLHGPAATTIRDLPEGYEAAQWGHRRTWERTHALDVGSLTCACGAREKHTLAWPSDAWFQIEHRREVLWAFHREHAAALREYVAGTDRTPRRSRYGALMRRVPSTFLEAKARESVVRKLDRLLSPVAPRPRRAARRAT